MSAVQRNQLPTNPSEASEKQFPNATVPLFQRPSRGVRMGFSSTRDPVRSPGLKTPLRCLTQSNAWASFTYFLFLSSAASCSASAAGRCSRGRIARADASWGLSPRPGVRRIEGRWAPERSAPQVAARLEPAGSSREKISIKKLRKILDKFQCFTQSLNELRKDRGWRVHAELFAHPPPKVNF